MNTQHDLAKVYESPLDRFDYLEVADPKWIETHWSQAQRDYVAGMDEYHKQVRLSVFKIGDKIVR